jgi:hypothetical protein
MANIFGNLTTEGLEDTQDRLGGFRVLDTDAYTGTIKAAYAGKSPNSKAQSISVILDTEKGEYRETFWITNRNNENFFRNKQDNTKKVPLPGFVIAEDLCLVTTNKPLSEQTTEDKVMNIYDPELKKEVPKSVPMLVELLGKKVTFGILKELKNRQVKNASTGEYEDTAESREENTTDKVFHHPSNLTVVEARQGTTAATFYTAWLEKNKGNTRDRRSIKDGAGGNGNAGRPGRPGTPPKAGETQAKTPSLFSGN